MRYRDKVIFDFETTGLLEVDCIELEKQPHAIELYVARLDYKNNVIDEFESFFSVPVDIPNHIKKMTNINESMLIAAPQFIEKYKELVEIFMGARTMIAHNLPFDAGIMWAELSRIDKVFKFPWPPEWYCTIEHSIHIENKRLKLGALHEYATGEEFKVGAHRAKQDVMALLKCYKWLTNL